MKNLGLVAIALMFFFNSTGFAQVIETDRERLNVQRLRDGSYQTTSGIKVEFHCPSYTPFMTVGEERLNFQRVRRVLNEHPFTPIDSAEEFKGLWNELTTAKDSKAVALTSQKLEKWVALNSMKVEWILYSTLLPDDVKLSLQCYVAKHLVNTRSQPFGLSTGFIVFWSDNIVYLDQ